MRLIHRLFGRKSAIDLVPTGAEHAQRFALIDFNSQSNVSHHVVFSTVGVCSRSTLGFRCYLTICFCLVVLVFELTVSVDTLLDTFYLDASA